MPAQKRPPPPPSDHCPDSDDSPPHPPPRPPPDQQQQQQQVEGEQQPPANQPQEQDDTDGEGGSPSSPSTADKDEFILVKLADIRKEVQCPICLGIIRKTRTVMECLHRFCRECIDKSMRLGNNECPACRTHCASRRSLRDDANYDALIAALYPDIDKYEGRGKSSEFSIVFQELAFHDEEKNRNRKIQESIAETLRRQSEALGRRRSTAKATAAAFVRKSQGNFRSGYSRGRGRSTCRDTTHPGSDDDDDDDDDDEANGNDCGKDSSSAEERSPDVRQKRCRRWTAPRSSPARPVGSADVGCEEIDDSEMTREPWDVTVASRFFKSFRMAKLVEYLRNLDENDDEFEIHLTLLPLDEQSMPSLKRPYLCCRPTLSIRHLCQFIAIQASAQAEEIEIFVRKPKGGTSPTTSSNATSTAPNDPSEELQVLGVQESLVGLHASLSTNQGDLVLFYRLKMQS